MTNVKGTELYDSSFKGSKVQRLNCSDRVLCDSHSIG